MRSEIVENQESFFIDIINHIAVKKDMINMTNITYMIFTFLQSQTA